MRTVVGGQRRRGADLEQAILRAAADELTASGYAGMTMEKVAQRAGTNKNAIYRRWPQRAALGIAAYKHLADARTPAPDTGSLRGDALELLRQANATWVASLPMTLLRGEYALRGVPAVPDEVLVEIVDEVFLPLVRGRGLPNG